MRALSPTHLPLLALLLGLPLQLRPAQDPAPGGEGPPGEAAEGGAAGEAARDPHAAWRARLVDDGRPVVLEDTSGNACLECHAAVGAEWAHSTHATAWQDPHYQQALKRIRRKQGCWGCHAPADLRGVAPGGTPAVREEARHLGVTCTTCHLAADGETVLGPAGRATDAHPTEAHELFDPERSNALCITCHDVTIGPVIGVAKDFVETDQAGAGYSCVECHMPALRRPWAEDPRGDTEYEARRAHSHRLETPRDPAFLRTAFDLDATWSAEGVRLAVLNLTGHRVPGLIDRELRFTLKLLDAAGETLAETEHRLDHRAWLPVEEELELTLAGAKGVRLAVEGTHLAPGMKAPVVFLERTFERER